MTRGNAGPDPLQSQELLALLESSMPIIERMASRYFQSPSDAQRLTAETRDAAKKFITRGENVEDLRLAPGVGYWLFRLMHEAARSRLDQHR